MRRKSRDPETERAGVILQVDGGYAIGFPGMGAEHPGKLP